MAGQRASSLIDVDSGDFMRGLETAISGMRVRSRTGLVKVGNRAANQMKVLCPVDYGRMRAAIAAHLGEDAIGPYIDVGVTLEDLKKAVPTGGGKHGRKEPPVVVTNYSLPVEYGHMAGSTHVPPQPFFRPALAEVAGYFPKTIAGEMGDVARGG